MHGRCLRTLPYQRCEQLTRGNVNTGTLSIGFPDSRVPPLPGCIDGPIPGGLATHGRFEGDVSIARQDHGVGDSVDFQDDRWDMVSNFIIFSAHNNKLIPLLSLLGILGDMVTTAPKAKARWLPSKCYRSTNTIVGRWNRREIKK